MDVHSYYEQRNTDLTRKIIELKKELPSWFSDFLRACESQTSALTRLNYTFDTRIFLKYLISEHSDFAGCALRDISTRMLDGLRLRDLEKYVEYLGYYVTNDDQEHQNAEHGKARSIASLRSLFKYLYKTDQISSNPATLLEMPKMHNKSIVYLSPNEVALLVDAVESGEGLTERQKRYHAKTVLRDTAIIVTFLTTGMRVSELVGINISDVDLDNLALRIIRKGGDERILYFDFETETALRAYLDQRGELSPHDPLFISLQGNRINVRTVENLVKKYAKIAAPLKNISPHKLRSTFGTTLYQQTDDIYLVADVLGHKDVNTTRKHYAAMSDENRRRAARAIKLRDD